MSLQLASAKCAAHGPHPYFVVSVSDPPHLMLDCDWTLLRRRIRRLGDYSAQLLAGAGPSPPLLGAVPQARTVPNFFVLGMSLGSYVPRMS